MTFTDRDDYDQSLADHHALLESDAIDAAIARVEANHADDDTDPQPARARGFTRAEQTIGGLS